MEALKHLRDVIDRHLPVATAEAAPAELCAEGIVAITDAAELAAVGRARPQPVQDEGAEALPVLRLQVLRCLARALHVRVPEDAPWHRYYSSALTAVVLAGSLKSVRASRGKGKAGVMELEFQEIAVQGLSAHVHALVVDLAVDLRAELLAAVASCFKLVRGYVLRSRAAVVKHPERRSTDYQVLLRHWGTQIECGYVIAVLEHWLHTTQAPAGDERAACERGQFMVWAMGDGAKQSMLPLAHLADVERINERVKAIAFVLHTLKGNEPVARHALLKTCVEALHCAGHHAEAVAQLQPDKAKPMACDANLPPTLCMLGEICCVALAAQPPPPAKLVTQALQLFERFSGPLPKRLYTDYVARRKAERSVEAAVKRLQELSRAQQPKAPATPPAQEQAQAQQDGQEQEQAQEQGGPCQATGAERGAQEAQAQAQADADAAMQALLAEEESRAARAAAKAAKRRARQQAAQAASYIQRLAQGSEPEQGGSDAESQALSGPEQPEPAEAASDSASEQDGTTAAAAGPNSAFAGASPFPEAVSSQGVRLRLAAVDSEPPGQAGADGKQRPPSARASAAAAAAGTAGRRSSPAAAAYQRQGRREPALPVSHLPAVLTPSAAPLVRPRPPPSRRLTQQTATSGQPFACQEDRTLDVFTCPITQELLREPVIDVDGFTYERDAIEA